jgi:cytochrome c553
VGGGIGRFALAASLAAGLAAGGPARADDIDAGQAKARPCAVCHGPLGVATLAEAPHLAGQPASYLAAQLRAYRSGARHHEVMSLIAKPLTDDDITALAAWYAAVRVEATPPR